MRAAESGYDRLLPPHVFLAMLGQTEGVAEHYLRLQAQPEIGPGKVGQVLAERKLEQLELIRANLGNATQALLTGA